MLSQHGFRKICQKKRRRFANLYFQRLRVLFRGWECFHSIRKQILLRPWWSKKFPTFPKNIFSVDPKMGTWFFRRNLKSQGISLRFPLCNNMLLHNGNLKEIPWDLRFRRKNHVPIFGSTEKIFFGKVGNFFDHQGRSKICLRIEWKHSQPLKSTLSLWKYKLANLRRFFWQIFRNPCWLSIILCYGQWF